MAIHASFLIPRPGVNQITMGQHRAPFIGNVKEIPVALLALCILERGISDTALLFVVKLAAREMDDNVLDAVRRLGIKEIEGVMGCGQVAVHAIGHKPVGIVRMGGGLPGVVGKLDFVAGCTKLGSGGPNHGEITYAEKRKSDGNANGNINGRLNNLSPGGFCISGTLFRLFHIASKPTTVLSHDSLAPGTSCMV